MKNKNKSAEVAAAEVPAAEAPKVMNDRGEVKAAAVAVSAEKSKALSLLAAESVSIQNTLEVVQFGVALAEAIKKAKENDGKINLGDIGLLFPVAPLVVPMINDIGQVPKELGDLSEDELAALLAEVSKILGSDEGATKLAIKVKAAIKFAHAGYDLYVAFAK